MARAESIAIRWLPESTAAVVEVSGLSHEALRAFRADALQVFAEQASGAAVPPMAGRVRVVEGRLRFEPQFPLTRGVRYRAEFRATPASPPVVSHFELPRDTSPPTTVVTHVYPSADVLPENQLKFYVHFSAPMARGAAYEHVRIRDAAGQAIELPFLELDEELWDPSMTRLTLLIDPGRIKRGVKPLEDLGPVFEAGKNYSLTIETAWHDAAGRPLREGFEKKFRAGPADRTPPDPQRWKIRAPAAGTREPAIVDFEEPIDHALATRLIGIVAASGGAVEGDVALENHEARWLFTPDKAWTRGDYRLSIAATIEDLAGNNVGKTFDVDLFETIQRKIETPVVSVPFAVK